MAAVLQHASRMSAWKQMTLLLADNLLAVKTSLCWKNNLPTPRGFKEHACNLLASDVQACFSYLRLFQNDAVLTVSCNSKVWMNNLVINTALFQ